MSAVPPGLSYRSLHDFDFGFDEARKARDEAVNLHVVGGGLAAQLEFLQFGFLPAGLIILVILFKDANRFITNSLHSNGYQILKTIHVDM